eukprot:TRINITY_DN15491_c0_g1_i2.p1 TRINITY_DN15491_c0_g1~~TRINITY_DN15491_c0_g1_i2.p1  ORF type:complete len:279 (-),score=52.13 TRINITY_DN15491_c0_g1_i2:15-851(-)
MSDRAEDKVLLAHKEDIVKRYQELAPSYDNDMQALNWNVPHHAASVLLRHIEPSSAVCDVGAGTGAVGQALRTSHSFAGVLDAVDASPDMLRQAEDSGWYRNCSQITIEELPPSRQYDAVVCSGVLGGGSGHPGSEAVAPLCGLVRPGGVVVLAVRTDWFDQEGFDEAVTAAPGAQLLETVLAEYCVWKATQNYCYIAVISVESPKVASPCDFRAWYEAFMELQRAVLDPANQTRFVLQEGDAVVVNNHRMLHGRAVFPLDGNSQSRHLQLCYIDVHI